MEARDDSVRPGGAEVGGAGSQEGDAAGHRPNAGRREKRLAPLRKISPRLRIFAQRIIAQEIAEKAPRKSISAAFVVCERLRPSLATLMGKAGFSAILSRAFSLATLEVPSMSALHVDAGGKMQRLAEAESQLDLDWHSNGGVILVAHLLGLLVTLIGEDLTQRLVREVWPRLAADTAKSAKGRPA